MLKSLVALLLSKFIKKSSSDVLGAIDVSEGTTIDFPMTTVNTYNQKDVIAPFNGTVVFWAEVSVTDADIRLSSGGRQVFEQTNQGDSWLGLSCPVEKGISYCFSLKPKNTGTAKITFFHSQTP